MLCQILFFVKHFLSTYTHTNEQGQGLVEYAMIILLVAIVVVGALFIFGQQLDGAFGYVVDEFVRISPQN